MAPANYRLDLSKAQCFKGELPLDAPIPLPAWALLQNSFAKQDLLGATAF
jgi:hypothetical protein